MGRRNRRRSRGNPATRDEAQVRVSRPLNGVYTEELVDATSGHAKRLRRQDEHPLTLAYHRGQLTSHYPPETPEVFQITADERLAAGEAYRTHYETLHRSGRDSTDMNVGGGCTTPWTQSQADAGKEIKKIESRMHPRDAIVVRKFCGEGFSMVDALRAARIDFHPNGVTYRIREALDDLVAATTGRKFVPTPLDVA